MSCEQNEKLNKSSKIWHQHIEDLWATLYTTTETSYNSKINHYLPAKIGTKEMESEHKIPKWMNRKDVHKFNLIKRLRKPNKL